MFNSKRVLFDTFLTCNSNKSFKFLNTKLLLKKNKFNCAINDQYFFKKQFHTKSTLLISKKEFRRTMLLERKLKRMKKISQEKPVHQKQEKDSVLHKLYDPNIRISIIGRPNAGKSTLFNKLLGRRHAITSSEEHTTRDVHEKPFSWRNKRALTNHYITLLDTPGTPKDLKKTIEQIENAVSTSDLALFVTSYKDPLSKDDLRLAKHIKEGKFSRNIRNLNEEVAPSQNDLAVVHIVNKCDSMIEWDSDDWERFKREHSIPDFGAPFPVSAEHSIGFEPLKRLIEALNFRSQKLLDIEDGIIRMAIVGRANVGKSTLFNQLIGENRVLVSETPGTSRDSVELYTQYHYKKDTENEEIRQILLVDTAGLRKNKDLINDPIELESNKESLRAMKYANVVVMLIDASQGLQRKDMNILRTLEKNGRCVVLALNKWDLVSDPIRTAAELEATIEKSMKTLSGLPMIVLSAKHATNVEILMEKVVESYDNWNKKIPNNQLNDFMKQYLASRTHIPASWPTIKFISQVATRPPTFALFFKGGYSLPAPFERQIANALREEFGLQGLPIRLKPKPYGEQQ